MQPKLGEFTLSSAYYDSVSRRSTSPLLLPSQHSRRHFMMHSPRPWLLRNSVFLLTLLCVLFVIGIIGSRKFSEFPDGLAVERRGYAILSACIAESVPSLYENFDPIFDNCKKMLNFNLFSNDTLSFNMGRFGEKKYFLPFADPRSLENSPCYWLTIGIGGAAMAEKEFHERYPSCKIFGIEPGGPEQSAEFINFGEVVNVGVGPTDGNISMTVRTPSGHYERRVVPIVAIHKLLDARVHSRLIHFATLDIEGFEYAILQEMMNGGLVDSQGVVFCQMDVELHAKGMQNNFMGSQFSFDDFMRTFLENSPYTPVVVSSFLHHKKITIINRISRECERLFQFSSYWNASRPPMLRN